MVKATAKNGASKKTQQTLHEPDKQPVAHKKSGPTIFTIGHSTHPFDEFAAMLEAHDIAQLVDVRTIPKSRRMPHFSSESLALELPARGIDYAHLKALGGLRHPKRDSINTGWRNDSFRGYAVYRMIVGLAVLAWATHLIG